MEDVSEISGPPPLRRTLRRWGIGVGVLVAILAIAWLWWNHIANVRLQSRIDAILAKHEPLYPADFDAAPLSDSENAATYYRAAVAAKAPGIDSPASSNLSYPGYPPYPPAWHQLADAAVAANPRTLALMRQARNYSHAVWIPHISSPVISTLLPHLNYERDLANLVGDSAVHAHLHGDDAEAIERIRDVHHQAAMVSGFTAVEFLVDTGIEALAVERLSIICADNLQIEGAAFHVPPTTNTAIRPVSRRAIFELIGELSDEQPYRSVCIRALLGERMNELDSANSLISRATLLRPMLKLDTVHCLDDADTNRLAMEQANWPAVQKILATLPAKGGPNRFFAASSPPTAAPPRFSRALSFGIEWSTDRYALTEWRVIALRRVAVVSLAARVFLADHGRWPRDLNELVPAYLKSIPVDPFSASGARIGYVLQPATSAQNERPILFFDPTGSSGSNPPPLYPSIGWQNVTGRQWCDLTLWRVSAAANTTAPATQE